MPWRHDGASITTRLNVASGKAYRGINVIALWAAALESGYPRGIWGASRQWQELGAQVRKGERGHSSREGIMLRIASWLDVLRSDTRATFTAASKAQQIAAQQPSG